MSIKNEHNRNLDRKTRKAEYILAGQETSQRLICWFGKTNCWSQVSVVWKGYWTPVQGKEDWGNWECLERLVATFS